MSAQAQKAAAIDQAEVTEPGGVFLWRDYLSLCKPKVVILMLLCAYTGMLLATPYALPLELVIFGGLGIALVASSAATVNHLADARIDALMARTSDRPVATGRIPFIHGALFSAVLGITGTSLLWLYTNPLTTFLNLASWVGYGFVYTLYLKRTTPQNIVIGGLFGAAPPLFGWTAVTGTLDAGGLLLVMIIFVWTPPHFWALALDRIDEYRKIDIPMLPVTHGERYTQWFILFYTLLLVAASLLPFAIGMGAWLYLGVALGLGAWFTVLAIGLLAGWPFAKPQVLFRYSISYLILLFATLIADHYLFPDRLFVTLQPIS